MALTVRVVTQFTFMSKEQIFDAMNFVAYGEFEEFWWRVQNLETMEKKKKTLRKKSVENAIAASRRVERRLFPKIKRKS